MPNSAAFDNSHANAFAMLGRALGIGALIVGAGLLAVFAAAAAAVTGLLVLGAAIALRVTPKARPAGPETLNARRTPNGWVVETRLR